MKLRILRVQLFTSRLVFDVMQILYVMVDGSVLCYSDPVLSLAKPTLAVLCSQCRKRVVGDGFESGVILQILAADDRLNLCKDALGEVEPWRIWREEIDHVAC